MSTSIGIGDIAKKAALEWLHEVQEHEELMRKPISDWPDRTAQLAKHIQTAIYESIVIIHGG